MKAEHVAWIVDEARIRNQRHQALAQDPVRFANLNGDLEIKPLVTLNAYLRDCLQHNASSEPKKVASRNKIFVVQFGQLSLPIFQHLGFEVSTIDGEEYLILPRPPDAAGNTPIGSMRAYYEDLKHEILTLIDETGREQVKDSHPSAKARLERALSCYSSRYTARPRAQDNPADLHTLGVTENSNEDLLKFAFLCQMQTNPAKRGEYCTALQGLATSRSDDMQMFAALQMSMEAATREPITDPLVQAYVHFGMPDGTQDDSTIIARYELLCGEDPGRKKQHRQMLFRIGQARESQAIQNVARDMSDFKDACQFLDVDADEVGIKASADVLLGFIETQVRVSGSSPIVPPNLRSPTTQGKETTFMLTPNASLGRRKRSSLGSHSFGHDRQPGRQPRDEEESPLLPPSRRSGTVHL
jgi:ubiquitin carboxyl-terminal hydrolase 25/28